MRLVVIGGSVFLGRHIVEAALARGWQVTTFNRGRSAPDVPGVEAIRGSREDSADLDRLAAAGPWDAVVDVCGFTPRVVAASVRALSSRAQTYAFISTVGSYSGWPAEPVDETSARFSCASDAGPDDGDYGTLKAGCERAVEEGFDGRVLIINPGLILGPYENIGRLPAWLRTAARGGRFVAGGAPDRPIQVIDARDIAAFTLDGVERGHTGRYFTAGDNEPTTWGRFLDLCVAATRSDARPVWVDDDFLLEHDVAVWTELPLWAPPTAEFAAAWSASSRKALDAGLRCRPLEETIADTWEWLRTRTWEPPAHPTLPPHGLEPGREADLLAEWDRRG
jgi:2'-hydroxyisoflavone reductase